ncbi:MAG: TRAP transporter small permease [Synergistaceae bacterium]|nr:TRAP transporter small permease [Synergistaceae bacterium]
MIQKLCDHFEEIFGALILAVMVTVAFVNVITRYFIFYPLAFTEEITVSMFVWIVLLGTSAAFRRNAHLSMTFVYDFMPLSLKKVSFIISNAMCLVFFALLTWLGGVQVWDEIDLGVTSEALAIPTAIYSAGVPAFSALIIVRILQSCRDIIRDGSYR